MREDQPASDPSDDFVELVRDALLHIYDPSHLQTHALLSLVADDGLGAVSRGKHLRQLLLDAVESLHPARGVGARSRAWRAYDLLESRYIEGNDVAEVMEHIAIGKSQYHRDHHHALRSVAALFWEDWRLQARSPGVATPGPATSSGDAPERPETEGLLAGRETERIDPAEVLGGIGRLLEPLCQARGVGLRLDPGGHLPAISGDRVTLRQALLAILAPAINAASQDVVEVRVAAGHGRVVIQVRVRGCERTASIESGVESARPFVRALDGTVVVETDPDCPSDHRVVLDFPATDTPTLLVVDNNPDFAHLVTRFLSGYGWDVVGAPDVGQALQLARHARPRVVLLDIVLPGRDGWELLLELRATPDVREIPVIVCSVLDNAEVATSLGAAAYLHKPISQSQLVATLDRFRSREPSPGSSSDRMPRGDGG
ncbi:MAG: response regulator [Chloroflexota bacterium]